MGRKGGPGARTVAWLSARSMRIAGAVMTSLAGGVIALSVTTGYGLAPGGAVANATATQHGGSLTPGAIAAFTLAHPAYPAAVVLGLVLFALGDNVPLLGK